jgi:CHAT domain-containing protein
MPRLPPCHPELAGLLNDSAQLAQRDGNYADARRMYQQQLRMLEKCHTNANWLATALHNYANLFFEMGDLAEAERLHSRAVRVWSTRLGPRHTHVARGLDALAEVVAARGHHERARGLYERALRIRRARTSEAQPDVAWTLTNLARTVAALGELKRAHDFVSEAIGIYRRQGAFDEPDHLARAFELQGTILARQGMMREAGASATAALEERERIHGPDHPLTAESRTQLARIMFLTGERGTALTTALAADHTGREHLRFTVRYLPERQALAYAAKQPGALDLALSVAAAGTVDNTGALLDAVVRSRGVILEELARRTREFDVTDRQTLALRRTADHARQRYADLVVRSMGEPVSRAILEQARGEKEAAEEALAARSVEARRERLEDQAGLDEVRAALPPDSALVSIIKYERTLVPGARETGRVRRQPSYAAFVQRGADGGVAFVPLGPAEPLDALVNAWRDEAAGRSLFALPRGEAEKAYLVTAAKVRRALWDPLASQLSGFSQVFVVPDGLLNVLSIGSLPARTGGFIVEGETVLHYLSTERDLIRARADTAPAGLLAVGGASFEKPATVRSSTRSGAAPGCDQFRAMQFTNLPGTKREVDEISRLWNVHETGELTVLSGPSATESAVKSRLGNQRIVHLATHGFFLATECRFGATGTRGVGTIVPIAKPGAPVTENPLLLSGLALVGAGAGGVKRPDQDDGILTAEEIAGLQLQGTEWAVLSACNTGLGEIKSGEGVFGLRRAFQIAGARTVIMSLWSVDDDATREWMRALYEGRLERRLNTAQAVREASLTVLRARRAKRLTTHPFYWAAFVAAGDWR